MPLAAPALSALILKEFGDLGSDSPEANAQYMEGSKKIADAVANAVVQVLTTQAQVVIPPGAIQTAGSPTNHSNVAPAIGQIK